MESFITLSTELTKLKLIFSRGNLAVETLLKIVSELFNTEQTPKCEHVFE